MNSDSAQCFVHRIGELNKASGEVVITHSSTSIVGASAPIPISEASSSSTYEKRNVQKHHFFP
jgi:hypothetical protein